MRAAHCVCVSLSATANLSINKMAASRANQHAFFDRAKRACPFCCFSVLWEILSCSPPPSRKNHHNGHAPVPCVHSIHCTQSRHSATSKPWDFRSHDFTTNTYQSYQPFPNTQSCGPSPTLQRRHEPNTYYTPAITQGRCSPGRSSHACPPKPEFQWAMYRYAKGQNAARRYSRSSVDRRTECRHPQHLIRSPARGYH